MNVRLYANTSTLSLTERLEGGGFQPPVIPAYSHLQFRLRLVETINSAPTLDPRPLHALAARVGWPDRAPVSGSYQLEITYDGETVTTADIAYNATGAQIASAINTALSTTIAELNPCTVSEYLGLRRIVFADKAAVPDIECVENSLWPQSFVDVDEIDFDEGKAFVLQLRQAPVAEVSSFSSQVPGAPTVTQLQAGSEIDGYAINEIQKLSIPPAFEGGSFVIVRDGKKTVPIGVPATIDDLRVAVAAIADEGGIFQVTEVNDGAYFEFQGSMAGIDQDLLTIEVFESPGSDIFFALNTATDSMRTLMQSVDTAGQVRIPMNIHLQITDALAPGGIQKVTIAQDLIFVRPVSTGEHNVAAALNWNQPLSRADYLAHSTDSLLIGNRAITKVIGDGTATSFTINHNLLEIAQTFTASSSTDVITAADHGFVNGDPVNFANAGGALPGGLSANVTYWVIAATTGTFKVATTPGGTAVNLTSNGTGTNTVTLADGTVADAVMVQVWKTGGSKELVSPEDYTATRPSNNSVVVSGFATTPTVGQYQVNIMTVGRPATYLAHTHPIAEVLLLQDELDAIKARLAALEANTPSNPPVGSVSSGASISRPLGNVWRVPRARQITEKPGSLLEWRVAGEELGEEPRRPIRLLPAVHDASTESLPSPLPAPGDTYKGRVFSVSTTRTDFPGGGLKSGDFAACDGREWYQVTRQGTTSSYHPTPFEMVLFRTAINEGEFPNASKLELMLGFEAVVFMLEKKVRERLSACHWTLLIESGTLTAETTPGTPGANLGAAFGSPVVLAEQRITLTEIPSAHRFGVVINRAANGTLSADKVLYTKQSATTAPSAVPMALRARLVRFDTENDPTDARGVVAVRGLDVGLDGQPDSTLGMVKILN